MRGLVLPGVCAAVHSGPQQAGIPSRPSQHRRCHGHPALLRVPGGGRGRPDHGAREARRRKGLPGQVGPGVEDLASPEDSLCDAAGTSLSRPADSGADSQAQHQGVWPPPALPLCGCHPLLPTGPPG